LTVRDNPGGFVAPYLLNEVQVGTELETTGPAGQFYHEPLIDGEDLVFLAGGSGITPFRSIIGSALERGDPFHMQLLYGSRDAEDVIFGDELEELAAEHDNIDYSLVISEPLESGETARPCLTGFLDADLIREQVGDIEGKTFYICGPPVMYDFCEGALTQLGVPPHKIRRELFGPPADVTQEPGWPEGLAANAAFEVEVESPSPSVLGGAGGVKTIRAPAGEPLINSLERYGIVVPAVCRTGECSACRTRLLSGQVFQPTHVGLRESDRQHGYIHACMSYPLENLRIRL
jgi:ferredoxin-NADP reductase/ferredoxin